MTYKKIIRIKDKKVFYILDDEFLCNEKQIVLKTLDIVKNFETRFRYFVIGIDK